jgi:hypothetical protein
MAARILGYPPEPGSSSERMPCASSSRTPPGVPASTKTLLSSAVAFRAICDGVRVYETSKADSVRVIVDVMRRYDDDAPRRVLFRRAAVGAVERMPEARRGRP